MQESSGGLRYFVLCLLLFMSHPQVFSLLSVISSQLFWTHQHLSCWVVNKTSLLSISGCTGLIANSKYLLFLVMNLPFVNLRGSLSVYHTFLINLINSWTPPMTISELIYRVLKLLDPQKYLNVLQSVFLNISHRTNIVKIQIVRMKAESARRDFW